MRPWPQVTAGMGFQPHAGRGPLGLAHALVLTARGLGAVWEWGGAGPCPECHAWEKGKPLRGRGCSDPSMDLTQNGARRMEGHFVGGGSPSPLQTQVLSRWTRPLPGTTAVLALTRRRHEVGSLEEQTAHRVGRLQALLRRGGTYLSKKVASSRRRSTLCFTPAQRWQFISWPRVM